MAYKKNAIKVGSEVYLNVYDLVNFNDYLYNIGFGLFHSGIEINGVEYSFGEDVGISEGIPKEAFGAVFRESILLGTTYLSNSEILKQIDRLRDEFPGSEYHMILKNCNNFSNAMSMALLNEPIPNYINRCAYLASFFSCLFPQTEKEPETFSIRRFNGEANRLSSSYSRTSLDKEKQRQMRLQALASTNK